MKRRKDGRFVKTVDGKSFYGHTEREVMKKILEYERKKEKGATFAEVANDWWRDAWERISPTTVRGYKGALERSLVFFDKYYISEMTPRDISSFLNSLARKKLARKTVLNHKIVVSQIFKYAIAEGYVMHSPCDAVDLPRGLTETKRRPASESDEDTIRSSADVWIMPYMALMTGLRKGELLALQWKDIDFERNLITVSKSLYYEGGTYLKEPKTEAGNRKVPLLSGLKDELLKIKGKPNHFILSGDDKPLSQKRFRTQEKHYREQTGITCTLHQLRKSFSTIAVNAGVPPKTLQVILGHKQISTTLDIYTEVRNESLVAAADILNSTFENKAKKD